MIPLTSSKIRCLEISATDEFGWYHDALSSRDEGAFYICAGNVTNVCNAKSSEDLEKHVLGKRRKC